jgi:polysaccharide export outer membrane protein
MKNIFGSSNRVWPQSLAALVAFFFAYSAISSRADDAVLTTTNSVAADDAAAPNQFASDGIPKRVLSPNDVITVKVYQEDDLTTKVMIDKSGVVMLPLLGQVKIGGMTMNAATLHIQELYNKDYLVDPHVNITLEQFAERKFTVLGEVRTPGSFDLPQNEPMNLLEAIATAGGFTRLGESSKVMVQRRENGTLKVFRLNADDMARDQKTKPFEILPNDIITVTEKTF